VAWDRLLDTSRSGPLHLGRPEIAELVWGQLMESQESGGCVVHACVVMPNHVHVLWTPHRSLAELIRQVKGPTACRANRILGRAGEAFWQGEYFDREVRSEKEFVQIQRYVEWNPVKAGLVTRPEEFRWSSAYEGRRRD